MPSQPEINASIFGDQPFIVDTFSIQIRRHAIRKMGVFQIDVDLQEQVVWFM